MKATIINRSGKNIKLDINGKTIIITSVQKEQEKEITGAEIEISAKINEKSEYRRGKCFLRVESIYTFSEVKDGELFEIICEKSRAIPGVFLERIFIKSNNGICQFQKCVIPDAERMRKAYKRRRVLYFFLIAPIELLTELVLVLVISGIIATSILGWEFALFYFPVAYMILLLIVLLALKGSNLFLGKCFGAEDEKKEFYQLFDTKFLKEYYSNQERDICM